MKKIVAVVVILAVCISLFAACVDPEIAAILEQGQGPSAAQVSATVQEAPATNQAPATSPTPTFSPEPIASQAPVQSQTTAASPEAAISQDSVISGQAARTEQEEGTGDAPADPAEQEMESTATAVPVETELAQVAEDDPADTATQAPSEGEQEQPEDGELGQAEGSEDPEEPEEGEFHIELDQVPTVEGVTAQPSENATWAVFIYMCGTDLESGGAEATKNLNELLQVPFNGNVNVFVQTGGTQTWHTPGIPNDSINRYYVSQEGLTLLSQSGQASMGQPGTLQDFVRWGADNYPAEKMGLILWNHGGGSLNGAELDELFGFESLSLLDMGSALSGAGTRFEFIGFDACLMATVETASILAPHANYLIASEELEPGPGWDYTVWASYLNDNPGASGADLGKVVGDSFYQKGGDLQMYATLSCVDLDKMGPVASALEDIAAVLDGQIQDAGVFGKVIRAAGNTEAYGGFSPQEGYSNQIDLGHFMENLSGLARDEAINVISAVNDAVTYKISGDARQYSSGLSVYFPQVTGVAQAQKAEELGGIFGSNYRSLINNIARIKQENEDAAGLGNSPVTIQTDPYVDKEGTLRMTISPSTIMYVNRVDFSLFMMDGGDAIYLGSDDEVEVDWRRGNVSDGFTGYWPSINGEYVSFFIVENTPDYIIYSVPVLRNGKETNLRVTWQWDEWDETAADNAEGMTGHFTVAGTWDGIEEVDEDTEVTAKGIHPLQDGDKITPVYYVFDKDDNQTTRKGKEIEVDGELEVEYKWLQPGDYHYGFDILDVYGNWIYTDYALFMIDENGDMYADDELIAYEQTEAEAA